MSEETITITAERYAELIEHEDFLFALQGAGVDNWCGYDMAIDMMEETEEDN